MTAPAAIRRTGLSDLQHGPLPGRMVTLDVGRCGVSETCLDPDDPIFAFHFPEWPVLPGSFVLRTALATAAIVEGAGAWRLGGIERLTYRRGARPGDDLRIAVKRTAGTGCSYSFVATSGGARIGDGEFRILPGFTS